MVEFFSSLSYGWNQKSGVVNNLESPKLAFLLLTGLRRVYAAKGNSTEEVLPITCSKMLELTSYKIERALQRGRFGCGMERDRDVYVWGEKHIQ